jgi:hypothetical protein
MRDRSMLNADTVRFISPSGPECQHGVRTLRWAHASVGNRSPEEEIVNPFGR